MFPTQYKDYPGGVESFEVYTPAMRTLYSQVWWQPLDPVDFPADIVRKYNGTGMAIVGWEIDQVRRTPDGDVSEAEELLHHEEGVEQVLGRLRPLDGVAAPRGCGTTGNATARPNLDARCLPT